MATLTPQSTAITGIAPTFVAATGGGDNFVPGPSDERTFLWIKNGSGGSITVTIGIGGSTFGQVNPDVAVVVPAGQERVSGPLHIDLTGPDLFGFITFSYTGVTSLTVALVRLEPFIDQLP
jgi:hypothetical protein